MIKFLVGVYFGAGITWCLLMLSKNVREGEVPQPPTLSSLSRTTCIIHDSPMSYGELCGYAKQIAPGGFVGVMCVPESPRPVPFHPFRIQ